MRELLLIRHGQASFHAEDYDCLSDVGERQSRALGDWLAECGQAPDLIAIGPRRRHADTARHALASAGIGLAPVCIDGLDEVDHQVLLARLRPDLDSPSALRDELRRSDDPRRAFQAMFVAAIARWTDGAHDHDYPSTWPQFRAHVLDALARLADSGAERIWAFTSGGPIAVIAASLLSLPPSRSFELSGSLVNSGISRIALHSRGPRLVTYNSWPHLERGPARAWITLR